MSPYELFVGLRYTRAKRSNNFISFISLVSTLGMALGIAVLITVISVMNGFQKEVRDRILGVLAHIQIQGIDGPLTDWPDIAARAQKNPEVRGSAPYVLAQGLLGNDQVVRGAIIRGILPEREAAVADFATFLRAGSMAGLAPDSFAIVLGVELARALGVGVGDKVLLIAPQGQITPAGVIPRLKQFNVVAIFEAGHFEFDSGLALVHMKDAQTLYRLGDAVSGVRLKISDMFQAPRVSREIAKTMTQEAMVADWSRLNTGWFRAVEIEKRMMFIILSLIVAVAAFNIVSTLVMVVTEKRADIAILRTLGATPASVMGIFVIQGALIGVFGTLLGVGGGVLLAANVDVVVPFIERSFGVQFLTKDIYFISELPSEVRAADVVFIASISLLLSFFATLYPSWRASRINPAQALRYE
ncbi:MAG: lipoprotein-releasing ABC transporter permease subunit [Proteobacteria bacterium]|nr:lipoprotein-releasing ABC transporter permease subunit [Burkholderiales bacterium]